MTNCIYSVKDTLAGFYTDPFIRPNDSVAIRDYMFFIQNQPQRGDLELYKLGIFDLESGVITPMNELLKVGAE